VDPGSGASRPRGRLLLQPQPVALPRAEILNRVIAGAGTAQTQLGCLAVKVSTSLEGRVPPAGPSRISHGERRSPALDRPMLTVRNRQAPMLRARGGHGRRGPTRLGPGDNGRQLGRRVRFVKGYHLPRCQPLKAPRRLQVHSKAPLLLRRLNSLLYSATIRLSASSSITNVKSMGSSLGSASSSGRRSRVAT
jgi:hypothetical protein